METNKPEPPKKPKVKVKIHWGGKVFEFDSPEDALKAGFHLQ